MALSKRKTTVAVLRGILGPYHGREDIFALMAQRSRSWVKKVSAGLIPLNEDTGRILELETGAPLSWLMGPPDEAPNWGGKPYTVESFEWHRARAKEGAPAIQSAGAPFIFALKIAAIGSSAGDRGKASLFNWRLRTFLEKCAVEFGHDDDAYALADSVLKDARNKGVNLAKIYYHDTGMEADILEDPELLKLVKTAPKKRLRR